MQRPARIVSRVAAASTLALVLVLVATSGGCASRPREAAEAKEATTPGWRTVSVPEMSEGELVARERAIAARNALLGRLMATLKAELANRGPEGAIEVCRVEAPRLAAEVSEANGVRIGRTSFLLRNPENAPPDWARDFVAERAASESYRVAPDGVLAALLPIRLQEPCLACHGPVEQIHPRVRAALAASYPEDQAVGFHDGDLRGWFWIEVPPRDR